MRLRRAADGFLVGRREVLKPRVAGQRIRVPGARADGLRPQLKDVAHHIRAEHAAPEERARPLQAGAVALERRAGLPRLLLQVADAALQATKPVVAVDGARGEIGRRHTWRSYSIT